MSDLSACNAVRPGTLGYQQCVKKAGHEHEHMSQDRGEWNGPFDEIPAQDPEHVSLSERAVEPLPSVAEVMDRLDLRGKRIQLNVHVNLDPVPGWGNTAEDFRAHVQRPLDDSIGHYHPHVVVKDVRR